jgi:hypothetical protein
LIIKKKSKFKGHNAFKNWGLIIIMQDLPLGLGGARKTDNSGISKFVPILKYGCIEISVGEEVGQT